MSTAILMDGVEGAETRARFGGGKPPSALTIIQKEAKRALLIYPLCYAAGIIGTIVVMLSDMPR